MTDLPQSSWLDLTISMVNAAKETETASSIVRNVLNGIRGGRWAKIVARVSDAYSKALKNAIDEGKPNPVAAAKESVRTLKLKMPAATFSGTFKRRADSELDRHSGILCVDCDNCQSPVDLRATLANDPHVQAAFVSPTGSGVKALVRIAPDAVTHVASFLAVEKYFQDTYTITIDKACKDLSRLCYVAHDPDVFIRDEDAEIFEPIEAEKPQAPEKPQPPKAAPEETPIPADLMMLPKDGLVTNSASAISIFKKITAYKPPAMFVRGSKVVTIEKVTSQTTGQPEVIIEDMSPEAFISDVERYGTLFAWRSPRGQLLLMSDALMSIAEAKMLLACRERFQLSPISIIHNCPVLVERDGKPALLLHGYHADLGGRYITRSGEIDIEMPIAAAVERILELYPDFDFASLADKSRAITSMFMPALRFGGLLRCHLPVQLIEADESQAGKGLLAEMCQRTYGEVPEFSAKRKGGVGSFDEDLSSKLARGRPFIQIDNVRESLDSQFFESCMTVTYGATIEARIPYKRGIQVDPNRHIFQVTSNRFEATTDLANRACVVRIKKRPTGYQWKTFPDGLHLESHLALNPWPYLSAIYTIVARWIKDGKPRSEKERRGEGKFRDWWQVADWFARKIFELPSPLDDHEKIQRRVASAGQTWLRSLGNLLKAQNLLDVELPASQIVELINEAQDADGVAIPGVKADATDEKKQQQIGIIMGKIFTGKTSVEIDTFTITRVEKEVQRPQFHDAKMRKFYVFSSGPADTDFSHW